MHHLPSPIAAALVEGGKAALGAPGRAIVLYRLAVLSKAHQVRDLANPVRNPAVQELLRRIRRGYVARGVPPAPKTALTKEPLEALLAPCTDGLTGLRDRALLLFPFAGGGQRRSGVASAITENRQHVDTTTYPYRLTHSKTDQAGTARKRRR